jgi:hypothetical protein
VNGTDAILWWAAAGVAGVRRAVGLDHEDVRLLVGLRAMFDAPRNDELLALAQHDVAVAQMDRERSADDEEEVVVSSCLCQTKGPLALATWTL